MEDAKRRLFGIQFHPEVQPHPRGDDRARELPRGLRLPPGLERGVLHRAIGGAHPRHGGRRGRVLCALSGGVDSAVAALLVHRAIGDRLTCVFVDNGLLRKDEAAQVRKRFADKLKLKVVFVDATRRFLSALRGRDRSRAQAQDHRPRVHRRLPAVPRGR